MELSLTAFKARLVLKCLTGFEASFDVAVLEGRWVSFTAVLKLRDLTSSFAERRSRSYSSASASSLCLTYVMGPNLTSALLPVIGRFRLLHSVRSPAMSVGRLKAGRSDVSTEEGKVEGPVIWRFRDWVAVSLVRARNDVALGAAIVGC